MNKDQEQREKNLKKLVNELGNEFERLKKEMVLKEVIKENAIAKIDLKESTEEIILSFTK